MDTETTAGGIRRDRALPRGVAGWAVAVFAAFAGTVASGQNGAPVLTVLNAGTGGASSAFLSVDLANGGGRVVDRLTSDPSTLRSRPLSENLFEVIGRATDQAAGAGEVFLAPIVSSFGSTRAFLFVETPIGYAAYFEGPSGVKLGQITTLTKRPFEEIGSADGNYALLMRHDSTGRTEGAYLYHGTAGVAVYLDGLRKLEISPATKKLSGLPVLAGPVTAVELHAGREATGSYLVADAASGEIHFLNPGTVTASQMTARRSEIQLYGDVFSREGAHTSARRLLAVAVGGSLSSTQRVLLVDAVTGETAVIENVNGPSPVLTKGVVSVNGVLGQESGDRVFSAVPRVSSSGATVGVWLLDSQTGSTLYLDRPGEPGAMTVRRVTVGRR